MEKAERGESDRERREKELGVEKRLQGNRAGGGASREAYLCIVI